MSVHGLIVKGRLLQTVPERAVCPWDRKPLDQGKHFNSFCSFNHFQKWGVAEDERDREIENGEIEEDQVYREPECRVCHYFFATYEDLEKHLHDEGLELDRSIEADAFPEK